MPPLKIQKTIGKDLSKDPIDFMIRNRIREYGKNTKDFESNEQESLFFFLKEGEVIKAFGMLKPVTLYYDSKEYSIMGIANVMAMEKSKGYGTILMTHIRNYLEENNYIGMGNTHKDNLEFYKKCGFQFFPGFGESMVHIDDTGKENREDWTDYCMFIYDKNDNLKEVINGQNEVIIKVPLW